MRSLTCVTRRCTAIFGTSATSSTRFTLWNAAPSGAFFNRISSNDSSRGDVSSCAAAGNEPPGAPPASRIHSQFTMIALRDDLPLIELRDGQAVVFERDWLIRALAKAA